MSSALAPPVLISGGATPSVRREIDASVSKTVSNDTNLGAALAVIQAIASLRFAV
jgi:hypothetical protein